MENKSDIPPISKFLSISESPVKEISWRQKLIQKVQAFLDNLPSYGFSGENPFHKKDKEIS